MSEAVYFGCLGHPGHFFYLPWGQGTHHDRIIGLPWAEGEIDGALCPGWKGPYVSGRQIEGEAKLHHRDGWTALAFWDRSVDSRPGCNSVFFFHAVFSFEQALAEAKKIFPQIFARFTFVVRETG